MWSTAGETSQFGAKECRICLSSDNQDDIVAPCKCTGTVKYAHISCLRAWCMENLALKCEICGSVYTDEVVNALMSTIAEAQDRQATTGPAPPHRPRTSAHPWPPEMGQGVQIANNTAVRIDLNNARLGDPGGLEGAVRIVRLQQQNGDGSAAVDPEDERRAQERMQAFLEELLQIYVRPSTPLR